MLPASLFETVLANLELPVILVDEKLSIVFINHSAGKLFGFDRQEITGQSLGAILNIDYFGTQYGIQPPGKAVLNLLVNFNRPVEIDGLKKDGTMIALGVSASEATGPRHHLYALVFQDLTSHRQAEQVLKDSREILQQSQSLVVDLREFTETQEALRASESRYRAIVEDQTELICRFDLKGTITFVNEAYCRYFLRWREMVIGTDYFQIIPEEQRTFVVDQVRNLNHLFPLIRVEHRVTLPSGDTHWMEWTHRAILDDNNQMLEIQSVGRDITQRRLSEEEIHFRTELEKLILTLSTHFINIPVLDIDNEIRRALREVGEFCKVDRSYVFQINREQGTVSNTHEWCAVGIESQITMLQDQPLTYYAWMLEKLEKFDNVHILNVSNLPKEARAERDLLMWLGVRSMLAVPLISGKNLIGFLGFDAIQEERTWSQDSIALLQIVSDMIANAIQRRQAEQKLRQSEARSRALLSAIPDMMFRLDRNGIVLDYASGEEGIPYAARLVGQSLDLVMPPEVFKQIVNHIHKTLDTGKIQTLEFQHVLRGEIRHYEARFVVSAPEEVIAIIRNTSEQVRLEQMKSDFIHRATHELRTPVTTSLVMLNLIQDGGPEDEIREYWNILKGELERQRNLIEDLLTVGRLEGSALSIAQKPVDLLQVLQGANASILPLAQSKQIQVRMDLQPNLPCLVGDSQALQQAFVNLLNNAIKFTPPAGQIDVRAVTNGVRAQVSIHDTGMGISKNDLPNLFLRFYRGRNAIQGEYPGSGIGLYIVRSVVEKMGGSVEVESELGKGSTFIVSLPI